MVDVWWLVRVQKAVLLPPPPGALVSPVAPTRCSSHLDGPHLPINLALFQASDTVPLEGALLIKFSERPRVGVEGKGLDFQSVAAPQARYYPTLQRPTYSCKPHASKGMSPPQAY